MKNKSHIPATQKIINNKIYRKFSIDVSESELKWHWDEKDRTVEIVNDKADFLFKNFGYKKKQPI